jgi:hypothetical protein
MIYLFCSAATDLYKQDALNCICYPANHFYRFRYSEEHVEPDIWRNPNKYKNNEGMIVFLDTVGTMGSMDFHFYPLRKIIITNIHISGNATYIDFLFDSFINYENTREKLDSVWNPYFKELPNRPYPPSTKSGRQEKQQGYFILKSDDNPAIHAVQLQQDQSWRHLINALDESIDLKESIFFRILGVFKERKCLFSSDYKQIAVTTYADAHQTVYLLPMGRHTSLRLLFYRPHYKYEQPLKCVFRIDYDSNSIDMPKKEIISDSRYNEENILIVSKRMFDSVLSGILINIKEQEQIKSPKPYLLVKIFVPKRYLVLFVSTILFSPFFLSLDPKSAQALMALIRPLIYSFKCGAEVSAFISRSVGPNLPDLLSILCKSLGSILIAFSGYLFFKRFPFK